MEIIILCNLIMEVTSHYFCYIALFRVKLLGSAPTPEKEVT